MKNYQKMLITFDELSVELSKAIKKNNYKLARISRKAHSFAQRISGSMANNFDPDYEKADKFTRKTQNFN